MHWLAFHSVDWLLRLERVRTSAATMCTASAFSIDLEQIMNCVDIPGLNGHSTSQKWSTQQLKRWMLGWWYKVYQSIDPATVQWQKGNLSPTHVWKMLEIDVTHVGSQLYLTVINCGPSCFAIWQLLHWQDTASIICQLGSIFYDQDPPAEIFNR